MANDMIILVRTFDLLSWLVPACARFPRVFRDNVTARLIGAALDTQDTLLLAQAARQGDTRLRHLQDSSAHVQRLRVYLRLAHHLQWPTDGQYAHVTKLVDHVGALLGGWLRQAQAPS
ncbi:MAG: four helix bundle protein [Pseudomonadota bacterium]